MAVRMTADFSTEKMESKKFCNGTIKKQQENNDQTGIRS